MSNRIWLDYPPGKKGFSCGLWRSSMLLAWMWASSRNRGAGL